MRFQIKAHDRLAGVLVYAVDAQDEVDARRQARASGREVISIRQSWTRRSPVAVRMPIVSFSQELVALLDAGLTMVEAIDTLTEKEPSIGNRRVLEQVRVRLFEGKTLSTALEEFPRSFSALYIATVRANERTGTIREALKRFIDYQHQIDLLRKKVISASIYPAILCAAGLLVTVFLLGFVVPRFSAIYADLGTGLPWASRVLMNWGQALQQHGFAVLLVLAGIGLAVAQVFGRPDVRAALNRRIARVPVLGRQLHLYQLSRLYRTVGMLLKGGMPAVASFEMSSGLLSPGLRPALARATLAVREGQSIAASMERHSLTTPVAARMLRVGERSGNMGEMMERIAAFYDEELARAVDMLTRVVEPALMTLVGIVIGVIVILMYFPIFELAGSIQ